MKYVLLSAAVAAMSIGGTAAGQPLPLNTGYNYLTYNLYGQPTGNQPSNITDNYWIKIASFAPPAPTATVQPAWVLNQGLVAPWMTLPGSRWIGPSPLPSSSSGTSPSNPAYSIFRKCFCLMPNYQNATLSFQMRADNSSTAWLNTITNVLVAPSPSSFNGNPLQSRPTTPAMFRTGRNCLYVLVEDTGVAIGFNLAGTVSALGLMPIAGAGVNASFAPCQCGGPVPGAALSPASEARAREAAEEDDSAMVSAIVAYAQERRRSRAAR